MKIDWIKCILWAVIPCVIFGAIYEIQTLLRCPVAEFERRVGEHNIKIYRPVQQIANGKYKIKLRDYIEWIPKDGSEVTTHLGEKIRFIKWRGY